MCTSVTIRDSLDIKMITPVMKLVFRMGLSVQQLVSANDDTIDLNTDDDSTFGNTFGNTV